MQDAFWPVIGADACTLRKLPSAHDIIELSFRSLFVLCVTDLDSNELIQSAGSILMMHRSSINYEYYTQRAS
jgi:hypothetical protein